MSQQPAFAVTPTPARLRALLALADGAAGLREDVVAEAQALGTDGAALAVSGLLDEEADRPRGEARSLRAIHLAHELGLAQAVPSIARLLDRPGPLRSAALTALSRLGTAGTGALLAALERADDELRGPVAEALARSDERSERILSALLSLLEAEPQAAARLLAERGEWRAVPHLVRRLDRLVRAPVADCGPCAAMDLEAIAAAVRLLGGELGGSRTRAVEQAAARAFADADWQTWDDEGYRRPARSAAVSARHGGRAP